MGMTATERLRALLDERGVEYDVDDTQVDGNGTMYRVTYVKDGYARTWVYEEPPDCALLVSYNHDLGAEDAIAATLGSCNCSNSERTGTCRLEGFADVPFSVDYEIEGYDMGSSRDYATLAECSSCGAYVILPPEYHHVLTCDGDEVYQPYRFCPNCGRRIEVDDG